MAAHVLTAMLTDTGVLVLLRQCSMVLRFDYGQGHNIRQLRAKLGEDSSVLCVSLVSLWLIRLSIVLVN